MDPYLPLFSYGIFSSIVQHCLSRCLHKRQGVSVELASFETLDELPDKVQTCFKQLCILAYIGARDNKITFSISDLEVLGASKGICEIGLLQAIPSLVPRTILSFSMLDAEKREGLVREVTCGVSR